VPPARPLLVLLCVFAVAGCESPDPPPAYRPIPSRPDSPPAPREATPPPEPRTTAAPPPPARRDDLPAGLHETTDRRDADADGTPDARLTTTYRDGVKIKRLHERLAPDGTPAGPWVETVFHADRPVLNTVGGTGRTIQTAPGGTAISLGFLDANGDGRPDSLFLTDPAAPDGGKVVEAFMVRPDLRLVPFDDDTLAGIRDDTP